MCLAYRNLLSAFLVFAAFPAWPQQQPDDLTSRTIEDLMNIKVTSVSKKDQALRTAAAIFVITQEDIRRSGATNIPDLLRMVPGVDVAQINGITWAISSRDLTLNSEQAAGAGRRPVVYTPNFSGVYWDTADLPLEDIDRIEVIRGPGGTVWGANAVNGVISIFTRSPPRPKAHGDAGGGNLDRISEPSYGGKLGKATDYRSSRSISSRINAGPHRAERGRRLARVRGGFRSDTTLSAKTH